MVDLAVSALLIQIFGAVSIVFAVALLSCLPAERGRTRGWIAS